MFGMLTMKKDTFGNVDFCKQLFTLSLETNTNKLPEGHSFYSQLSVDMLKHVCNMGMKKNRIKLSIN